MGYLRLLVRDTLLGSSTNDVAEKLLTVEAERRLFDGYHTTAVPTVDAEPEEGD